MEDKGCEANFNKNNVKGNKFKTGSFRNKGLHENTLKHILTQSREDAGNEMCPLLYY